MSVVMAVHVHIVSKFATQKLVHCTTVDIT